ncbi:phage tail tape measure protein [Lactiplantibacillus plantarum]|uniref:Prophage protein, tape-measure protein n=1 Tax=Lactiplantibacillus plantarum CMPG5300 TaxID=1304889 RepID=A0AAW3FMF9_LACPN|nr:phage tail tape measure protein [Lactiplantibacillus plantarum]ATI71895.1 phage tail tape measure protein [Lactiplantibacillus plantarum]KGH42490.1 prophage protein, tape-measure protein [Lactiplantibacillus plantarum CMPG5300]MCZ2138440.1 phage tail tape measure protein [Lactiplantibacillus plantarum]MCZ2274920.1 phage tail tape measure protein [Lactiplantibacillus plantarum]VTU54643.1 phage tail tape measure protein [Lactiplantibacillus plantarum]
MADIAGSVKINVDLIAKEALAQAEVLKRTFKDVDVSPKAAANLKVLNQGLETTAASYSKLSAAQEQARLHMSSQVSKLNSYKAQLQANRQEMTATAGEIGRLSRAEGDNSAQVVAAKSKYAALEREQQALVLSAGKLQKSVGALTPGMAAAADKAMAMGTKLQNTGEKISSLGSKATIGFTVPIVTAMGAATKSFINFDSQIKSMGALLDDGHTSASKLKSELNSLGDASKKWSVQYGVSTTQINDGMTEMIKKGYSFQQVMGGMPSILNATKASGDDFNDVMKVSTSTLEQFGLKSNNTATMLKNTQRVTDGLTYVANKTSAGFTDMGYAMEYVGPVAHGLNMSLEETSAAIGLMSNQGIEGQKAGTSLRGALSALLTPSKQNMEGFKALGVSVSDFKKGTLTLPDILDNIKAKSKGMTKQQLQSNLALAFGTEAQSGMNILVNEGGDALRKLTSETQNSTGYTKKLADTMNDTAKANVDKFKQSLNVLGIEAGQHLLPLVTEFLKHAKGLIERFNNLDPATQKLILNTGLAVAAGGPLISMFGKLTSGVGLLTSGSMKLLVGAAKLSPLFGTLVTDGGAASTVIAGLSGGAEAGSASLLGLGGSALGTVSGLGALAAAAAPVVLGVAAVGTATYFAIKAGKEHSDQLKRQRASMDEYGANISQNSQKAIGSFNELHQKAKNDMALLDTAVGKQSKQLSSDVVTKYSKMADLVEQQFSKTKKAGMDALSDLSRSFGSAGNSWVTQVEKGVDKRADGQTSKLEKAKKTMESILKSVDGDFSKLSATQKAKLNEAEAYIDSQVSAFGMAYKDQQALYKAYVQQHGTITDGMYKADVKSADSAYSKTYGKASDSYKKSLSELKSLRKNDQISKDQYDQALAMLDAKRNKQQTQASLEYIKTEKAAGDAYNNNGRESLRTKQTLDDEYTKTITDENGKKEKLYWDDVSNSEESAAKWIADHKKDNQKYIDDQVNAHGTIEKNIAKFQKSQEKAYEAMGMDADQAVAQAKVDADDLLATTTKSGAENAKAAAKIHSDYIKALNNGSLGSATAVAKQWGLDLSDTTSKIDLGKYGKKTAASFWNDIKSGSKTGYEEAKVYFNTILADLKSRNITSASDLSKSTMDELKSGLSSGVLTLKELKPVLGDSIVSLFPHDLSKVSSQEMKTLKQGLKDGVITLSDLNGQFNGKIMGLFPKDLSQLGKDDISTLKKGLKDGSITDSDLKGKYGKQYAAIFKQDLSKLGKSDIQSLKLGLDIGIITKSDLKTRYGKAISNIFDHDLKKIGQKDIDTLATGIDLGIPGAKSALNKLKSAVKSGAKINITGEGSWTMDTLNKAYADKKISTENYLKVLAAMVKGKTNIDIGESGRKTMDSYNDGINGEKKVPINSVTGTAQTIKDVMTLGQKAVGAGHDTMESFNQGLVDKAADPLKSAGGVGKGVAHNLDQGGASVNALSKAVGGKSSYTATENKLSITTGIPHKTGTNGKITSPETAIVGDGYKPELIDYGNGSLGLSPAVPTVTHLPVGAQVFSGEDTEKAAPILKMMGLPMFATGSGGNIVDWIKNLFGDAMKFMEHPIKNWEKLIDSSFDMNLFPGGSQNQFGPDTKDWEKKQTNWLKKLAIEGAGNPGGAGVTRWIPYIKRAAAAMHVSMPEDGVKKILNTINHESGGNPTVFQHGYVDVNTGVDPAQGLLQFIGQTFRYYAVKGHGNRANGYDQLLALFNDSNWYNDLMWNRGWAPSGHRRFDKGGESYEKQLAWVSEHNQREIHIPDDQSNYSKYLTDQAVKMSFGQQAFVATSAEQAAGLKSTIPVDAPKNGGPVAVSGAAANGTGEVLGMVKSLVDAITSKTVNITAKLDNGVLFNAQYPLIKLALGQDVVIDRARGGK